MLCFPVFSLFSMINTIMPPLFEFQIPNCHKTSHHILFLTLSLFPAAIKTDDDDGDDENDGVDGYSFEYQ